MISFSASCMIGTDVYGRNKGWMDHQICHLLKCSAMNRSTCNSQPLKGKDELLYK